MKLRIVSLGIALAAVWALIVFVTGTLNLFFDGYGTQLLKAVDSIYPGYHYGECCFWGVLVATLYSIVDGFLVGILLAWVYNLVGRKKEP